ncbi:MAG TPA: hypothetical protein PLQ12_06690 [Candidatus Defluviicoccus seviourii]|nr:hypothetical protein [Candidatus Defluviicoccus seviourii]
MGPEYIALAALIISAISAGTGAYIGFEQASAQKKIAEQQAEAQQIAADEEARQREERKRQIIAAQVAYFGAAGIPANEGSALALQLETERAATSESLAAARLAAFDRANLRGQAGLASFRRTMIPVQAGLQLSDQAVGIYQTWRDTREAK